LQSLKQAIMPFSEELTKLRTKNTKNAGSSRSTTDAIIKLLRMRASEKAPAGRRQWLARVKSAFSDHSSRAQHTQNHCQQADTHIALTTQPSQLKSGFMSPLKSLAVMLFSLVTRITLSQMSTLIVIYLARHGTLRIDRLHAGGTAP
jgi:hypothetical protein